MIGQQAVRLIDRVLAQSQHQKLNDLQSTIVLGIWIGSTYRSIADRTSYDLDYIKQIAAKLWKLLSPLLGDNICKSNIKSTLERYQESINTTEHNDSGIDIQSLKTWMISDHTTTVTFLHSDLNHQLNQTLEVDLQAQGKVESLVWQNSYKLNTSNALMNEILDKIEIRNLDQNPINCLIVNCYFAH
jgi:hypothetical protein